MLRMIDADKLINTINNLPWDYTKPSAEISKFIFLDTVRECPTVDAEPVRRGKWIDVLGGYLFECSRCKAQVNKKQFKCNLKYCPNCGVKMQEEIENG